MARVDVADTGCGLAEAVRSRLFELFATTKPHVLGVGLSIFTFDHRGTLWAEDTELAGESLRKRRS